MIYSIYTWRDFLSALPTCWPSCSAHRSTNFSLSHECLQLILYVGKASRNYERKAAFIIRFWASYRQVLGGSSSPTGIFFLCSLGKTALTRTLERSAWLTWQTCPSGRKSFFLLIDTMVTHVAQTHGVNKGTGVHLKHKSPSVCTHGCVQYKHKTCRAGPCWTSV